MHRPVIDSRMRYWSQYCEGHRARLTDTCPYPYSDLGRRCAWLAGQYDAAHFA